MEEVVVEKLVHGGQGMATLKDGRKVFLWNALPGERVVPKLWRSKKSYAEGLAEQIITPSSHRVEPQEPGTYLGSSPWQVMDFAYENEQKMQITKELFGHEGIELPEGELVFGSKEWHYRNKMEYSFWADEEGLHLALYNRGSHQKAIVKGSALAMPEIDLAAQAIVVQLNKIGIRGSSLKSLIVRVSQKGETIAALFVKDESFPRLELVNGLHGFRVYYSNPKSPASVPTKLIYQLGEDRLSDEINGYTYEYDVLGFFQGNVEVYAKTIARMGNYVDGNSRLVDMYSGVGSIGLSLQPENSALVLVEIDEFAVAMAKENAGKRAEVVLASTEKALSYIGHNDIVIFDPPRAGLHPAVIERLISEKPRRILYLSCNPATQARDIKQLLSCYQPVCFEAYNYFPKTPHIESLIVLDRV